MECEKDSSGFSRFWRPRALTLQRRVPCVLMSWLTVELLLTVTRGGEDRHVLLLTFCIYKQSGILLKREMPTTLRT